MLRVLYFIKNNVRAFTIILGVTVKAVTFESQPEINGFVEKLARYLKELDITQINYETSIDDVKEAVEQEINGPGKRLEYRVMNQKLRTEYLCTSSPSTQCDA